MATYLINAIASIPSNPQDDDVIRFGTPITTGIPSTIKKADGTTTEDAIVVGYEYRYFSSQSAWLKIGGDPIITTPLRDAPVLATSEFLSAILGAVHTNNPDGRLRKLGFALAHQALQEVNPLEISSEEVVLYAKQSTSITANTSLDIKTGITRHLFDDGYTFIAAFLGSSATKNFTMVPIDEFRDTNNTFRLTSSINIRYVNDTTFRLLGSGGQQTLEIKGISFSIELETP